ncbi:MAG: hypothetical protein JNM36_18390 [Chitinophagales bacterium]|nr:hypothetical protein [Chitinophagales bacterium]
MANQVFVAFLAEKMLKKHKESSIIALFLSSTRTQTQKGIPTHTQKVGSL